MAALFILRLFVPSYVQERAKNLATKQDIQEITDKMKSVETYYQVLLEKEKSRLQMSVESAVGVKNRAVESLTTFFEDCISLFGEKLGTNLGDLPIDDGTSLYNYETETKQLFRKIFVDYHRLLLYLKQDENVYKAASNVIAQVLGMERVFRKHFIKVKIALKKEVQARIDEDMHLYHEYVAETNEAKNEYDRELFDPLNTFSVSYGEKPPRLQTKTLVGLRYDEAVSKGVALCL